MEVGYLAEDTVKFPQRVSDYGANFWMRRLTTSAT